ncbi:MAG: tetratricopeptide repeat protein, partial [Candidatus Thorarchaeota archaeon]|nr:tetratricopeptide repeat protein [Candidatus Thorarchaeota archaeon]
MGEVDEYRDLMHQGLELLDRNDPEEAKHYFEDLIEQYPAFGLSYTILGGIYRQLEMYSAAELTLRKALELNGNDSFTLTQLGLTLCLQGRNREAEELLRKSLVQEPDDVGTMVGLAQTLLDTDRLLETHALLKRGAELEPENYWVWEGLGKVYREQADYTQSLDSFRRATVLQPENPYPVKGIADAQLKAGDLEQAQATYERALAIDPEYYHAKLGLAETFLKMEEYGICDGYLGELMDEDPAHWRPWLLRGQIHLNMGDLQQAEDCFNESISRNSYEADAYRKLLIVYERVDKVEEAEMTRGKLLALREGQEIVHDTGLEDIDPAIQEIVAELNSLGLHVHSAHVGSTQIVAVDDPDPARIFFWADYRDAPHHIFTICNMAGWVAYYEDDCIGAVWGGDTSSEIGDGWATLVQMARLVMPKLR